MKLSYNVFGNELVFCRECWREWRNKALINIDISQNIIKVNKLKELSWPGVLARMVKKRNACNIFQPQDSKKSGKFVDLERDRI